MPILDLLVIGAGINGAGIAADAAGRGLSVALFDAADFASSTSSASSKLVHGGLRYLEQYEFRLVSKALGEREVLLKKAPHLVKEMRFCLPLRHFLRPAWMIRCGLFLYDHLSKRTTLAPSQQVYLRCSGVLKQEINIGFEYSDCTVDDARLVLLNVLDAQNNGAEVKNYCRVLNAQRVAGLWVVTLFDEQNKQHFLRKTRVLVNAAGPWVKQLFDSSLPDSSPREIRMVKGSHIIVEKLHPQKLAYILQNQDKRIVFVIPYLDDFSLIGTTDIEYAGDPRQAEISEEEINYLLDVVNQYFIKQLTKQDIVWTYSGVRPLCEDEAHLAQAVTRDYTLEITAENGQAPLLSVFGGKLTTYRKLAESALQQLHSYFPHADRMWTASAPLPGGNFSDSETPEQLTERLTTQFTWLSAKTARRYVNQFGTLVWQLLEGIKCEADLGEHFGAGLYQREVDYFIEQEFAQHGDDILWRRSKLGLYLNNEQQVRLKHYVAQNAPRLVR
ncbi:MAG: glycerol-3-phosphate dehydrogenase [Psychromonas sp.]|nr:glycerol-3-phosphate dehydrogenase [Psychromonas sp.]